MRDRSFISCILSMSLFPPLSVHTTVLPFISSLYKSSAAIESAPAGSATIAFFLYSSKIVVQTFPSGTKTMSSITSLQVSKVNFPTFLTAAPSTKLSIFSNATLSF
ncbi:Uncharacterised protein [Streptococcus pneumoniae]|nr:Uncharacterised protein [Streptococcus pneumoniae]